MSKSETPQSITNAPVSFLSKKITLLQKTICFLASFDFERYRQLKWGYPKAIVTARGVAVFIPSAVVASTLAMWGPAIFGSKGEVILLVLALPLTVFTIDYALIAHCYSGSTVPASLNFMRVMMLLLSIALNIFVVAGANAGALLEDIEKELRLSPGFSSRLTDQKSREALNTAEQNLLMAEIKEADAAKKKLQKLITLRDAEIYGATLSDGVQRVRGQGTKAHGFNLEINETNQIADGGEAARKKQEKASGEANNLKKEREVLDAEIKSELKNRRSPGVMVSALIDKIAAGKTDVLMSTLLLLAILVVIDCSALILAHMTTPPELMQMVGHQSSIDVAKSNFDHEVELSELNTRRPHVEIKVFPGSRTQNASAKVFNMRNENPDVNHNDDERKAA